MSKILFSCVGNNDPYGVVREPYEYRKLLFFKAKSIKETKTTGSLLHCIEIHKPDIVYLYLSKEVLDREASQKKKIDDYILKCDKNIKINRIEKPGLINVHEHDKFYSDFVEIFNRIYSENTQNGDDIEVFANVSSGTPAMKSALQNLPSLLEYDIKLIQVSDPSHCSQNDRTRLVKSTAFNELLIRKEVAEMIKNFEYTSALKKLAKISKDVKIPVHPDVKTLLNVQITRQSLDMHKINEELLMGEQFDKYKSFRPFEILFEAILQAELKIKAKQYADFLRGLTPIFTSLLEKIIEENGEKVKDIHFSKKQNKMNNNERLCEYIALNIHQTGEIIDKCYKLRSVEKKIRNKVAHNICRLKVKDGAIEIENDKYTDMATIMKDIKKLYERTSKLPNTPWDLYEQINNEIIALLLGKVSD